jgi:hypothetical protein
LKIRSIGSKSCTIRSSEKEEADDEPGSVRAVSSAGLARNFSDLTCFGQCPGAHGHSGDDEDDKFSVDQHPHLITWLVLC